MCNSLNVRSRGAAERFGFTFEGVARRSTWWRRAETATPPPSYVRPTRSGRRCARALERWLERPRTPTRGCASGARSRIGRRGPSQRKIAGSMQDWGTAMAEASEHFDVLIIGAGLSGVGAGCHISTRCPGKTFALLEARDAMGGTWDLFRYPGIRSDSDMFTLGYSFRPWKEAKAIADGPAILSYIHETAAEYGVEDKIRYGHRAVRAEWSSDEARWTVHVERADGRRADAAHVQLPVPVHRLLPLRRAVLTRVRGHRAVRGTDHPPAALARGPRLRRQAGGRHRQRRHGGHAGSGDGRAGGPRHDAAALAELHREPPGRGPARADRAASPPEGEGLRLPALEERAPDPGQLPAEPACAEGDARAFLERSQAVAARGVLARSALHTALRARGPSASASSRTATCSRRCPLAARRSSPTRSRRSRRRGSRSSQAPSSMPTSSSPPPASTCSRSAGSRSPSTARRSRSAARSATRG